MSARKSLEVPPSTTPPLPVKSRKKLGKKAFRTTPSSPYVTTSYDGDSTDHISHSSLSTPVTVSVTSLGSVPDTPEHTGNSAQDAQVIQQLKSLGYGDDDIADPINVQRALQNNYANGNVYKAVELLVYFKNAFEGKLEPITHSVSDQPYYYHLAGSDNYNGVSCYIDSLLFAMFARMANFEPILFKNFGIDETRESVALFIRLWVNMLRDGKLITTDVIGGLLDSLITAGWKPVGGKNCQQDAGELFAFITEKLNMPLLTLKVDIAHGGKEDAKDDHKLINESLLHVPIPGSPSDGPILLEECLELYFANSVQVSRQLERRKTLESTSDKPPALYGRSSQKTIASVSSTRPIGFNRPRKFSLHIDSVDNLPRSGSVSSMSSSVVSFTNTPPRSELSKTDTPPTNEFSKMMLDKSSLYRRELSDSPGSKRDRERSNSPRSKAYESEDSGRSTPDAEFAIGSPPSYDSVYKDGETPAQFQRYDWDKTSLLEGIGESTNPFTPGGGTNPLWNSNRELTLPAWMFLQLLPFYTEAGDKINTQQHGSSSPVAQHFANARPVLGISLKRYAMTNAGVPVRNDRMVVVPKTIRFPSFVADDESTTPGDKDSSFGKFKLELESAVFHRGVSLNSGHFVAIAAEDAFVPYDDRKEVLAPLYKKKSRSERLFRSRSFLGTTKKDDKDETGEPVSPPSSAMNSPALRPVEETGAPLDRRWVLFDDLQSPDKKVTTVDYDKMFSEEVPYILFYRMVALTDEELGIVSRSNSVGSKTPTLVPATMTASSSPTLDPAKLDPPMISISPVISLGQRVSVETVGGFEGVIGERERDAAKMTPISAGFSRKTLRRGISPDRRQRKGKSRGSDYREEKCKVM